MVQQAELLTALQANLGVKLRQVGAREPDDGAHDVIVRLLESGTLDEEHIPAYWWAAARNMMLDQAKEAWRFVPWGEGFDVRDDTGPDEVEVEPDLSGLNLTAEELAWLLVYYEGAHPGRIGLTKATGRDRVKALRLRRKAVMT